MGKFTHFIFDVTDRIKDKDFRTFIRTILIMLELFILGAAVTAILIACIYFVCSLFGIFGLLIIAIGILFGWFWYEAARITVIEMEVEYEQEKNERIRE